MFQNKMIDIYDFTATPDELGNMRYDWYFTATPDELKYVEKYFNDIKENTLDRINKCPIGK